MSGAVMGLENRTNTAPWNRQSQSQMPTEEAIALGIANQLTNILRDVGKTGAVVAFTCP